MTDTPYRGSGSPHDMPGDGRDRFKPRVVGSGTPAALEDDPLSQLIASEKARTRELREIYWLDGKTYPPQPPQAAPQQAPQPEPTPAPRQQRRKAELTQLLRDLKERPHDSELLDLIGAHLRANTADNTSITRNSE